MREEFVKEFIFPAVKANAIYEDRYLMGTGNTVLILINCCPQDHFLYFDQIVAAKQYQSYFKHVANNLGYRLPLKEGGGHILIIFCYQN